MVQRVGHQRRYSPEIEGIIEEMTNKPWFSWAAHIDNRGYVMWGSDFVYELTQMKEDPENLRAAIQDYIDNRMREKA